MRSNERKARTEGGTERARNNINYESIITCGLNNGNGSEWFKTLYRHEVQTLIAAGASGHEIAVYAALTHWKHTPEKVYCVPAMKLAADTGLKPRGVYKALEGLQHKGIIECVRKPTKGHAAAYKVHGLADVSLPEKGERYAKNDVSLPQNGERYDANSTCNDVSLPEYGEQNPYPLPEKGELKEYINNGAGPLTVPAEPPSMGVADLFESLGISSKCKRNGRGAA